MCALVVAAYKGLQSGFSQFKGHCISRAKSFSCALPFFVEKKAPSLANKKITIGGVENRYNSCTISVLLQNLTTLESYYRPFLTAPLKKGKEETDAHFKLREELQKLLAGCVNTIQSGHVVLQNKVSDLTSILQKLGCSTPNSSFWKMFLHRFFPTLFPDTLPDPNDIYDQTFALLTDNFEGSFSHQTVFLKKTSNETFKDCFSKRTEKGSHIWRVAIDNLNAIEDHFNVNEHEFSLKAVNVYQDTFFSKHVVTYRKEANAWVCCDDAKVTPVTKLPTEKVYMVVYESHFSSSTL